MENRLGMGTGREVGVVIKGQCEDPYGDGNVLYVDYVSVSILVVIFYYNFVSYYQGEK